MHTLATQHIFLPSLKLPDHGFGKAHESVVLLKEEKRLVVQSRFR